MLNASLWQPVWVPHNTSDELGPAIFPSENLQFLNFTWNSTLEIIDYAFLRYNFSVTDPILKVPNALDYYFRSDIYSQKIICTYPISGSYGFLNRLLFYLMMIFALVVRKRRWLAAAAPGTSMTYSASAAAHAFALL